MDEEAEAAVRSAFDEPIPHNKMTIPDRATKNLNDSKSGADRVYRAIEDMAVRGVLERHAEPWMDWRLRD